ncbi:MAG: hypothetical protein HY863_03800 [Chloroflexi bacterium]|nr:hypothetical protein [Chloroflexota bacterium]
MDDLKEYRNQLVILEQKAQEDFDKTVLSLSSGALGVSFAFLKDVIGSAPVSVWLLTIAWGSWALSSTSVLVSYYMSHKALRTAIEQVDANKIRQEKPGRWFDKITGSLNFLGLILFVAGLVFMIWFVKLNLEG